jgi:hypothetical protein
MPPQLADAELLRHHVRRKLLRVGHAENCIEKRTRPHGAAALV